ncbi:L,D-transpeptidase family protein [Tabrizicola sp. BL-A-41-H6]|uniref:L,D-transpeptidase family protein n=1 Tax=Tabrizicola sp. BL-A-41-H6 TaxID=3421107 RepID=UPI003D6794BE
MTVSDCRTAKVWTAFSALFLSVAVICAGPVGAQTTAFSQSLATAAAADETVAEWYRSTGYDTLWTGADDAARRAAFLAAIERAPDHGLPVQRYDAGALIAAIRSAETEADRGRLEVALTRAYVDWAHDLTSGVLEPKKVDPSILREITREDPQVLLARLASGDAAAVLADLEPKSAFYLSLMKAKIALEADIAAGGWGGGPVTGPLEPGSTGPEVVALRDRLIAMGYLAANASQTYDRSLQAAVQEFQLNHGLNADGVAGESTVAEINVGPEARLRSVVVAMERERWMDIDRSVRHIWVNQPEFTARIIDHGKTVFRTRVVIGKNVPDQRSPEFSDMMEHMVINPSWGVPRSITVKEYLPLLQRNPNAVGHLQVLDSRGRVVPRGAVNFAAYNARNFPYGLRQPPSDGNALGLVKFMFPNPYNIYLHDTPSKSLFDHEVRAYSHGCIRVADPFDLAYALLSMQTATPEADFDAALKTGRETVVKLDQPVPVHLVYFTAFPTAKGKMAYARDVYGRDAALYEALVAAGVVLGGV